MTFDGVTVDLVDVTVVESPTVGPMLAGYEPATGRFHRGSRSTCSTHLLSLRCSNTRDDGGKL